MTRFLDIFFSSVALAILAPILIIVAIVLRITGEGEVLYLQERVGFGGKPFKLWKFATMLKNSPNLGTGSFTVKDDPRVLPIGRFLRKTKINELPQLVNIFKGDMSVVGPRPQTRRCFEAFPAALQGVIAGMRPGLSGIGPIVFRGEEDILSGERGTVEFFEHVMSPYKAEVEAWYASHQSLRNYFLVIVVTVWVVMIPTSDIVWRVFHGLPQPPEELRGLLNYPR
jgi:lipopolysaccharide/colanic/teichoic acid biosynthesis glycosyltransferase